MNQTYPPIPDEQPEGFAVTLSDLLVDAICGVGFPSIAIAIEAERNKWAFFAGHQHREEWRWSRDALRKMTEDQLQGLYSNLKVAQHGD